MFLVSPINIIIISNVQTLHHLFVYPQAQHIFDGNTTALDICIHDFWADSVWCTFTGCMSAKVILNGKKKELNSLTPGRLLCLTSDNFTRQLGGGTLEDRGGGGFSGFENLHWPKILQPHSN